MWNKHFLNNFHYVHISIFFILQNLSTGNLPKNANKIFTAKMVNKNDIFETQNEGGIHHSNEDFDTLIQEDEARALNNADLHEDKGNINFRTIDETSSHIVDIDNLHFFPETDSQDAFNFHDDHNIYIPTSSSQGPLSDNDIAAPISPAAPIDAPATERIVPAWQADAHSHAIDVFGTFAIVAAVAVIAIVLRSIILKRRAKRKLGKEVFKYILDFDVEDVDLTRAVTGGWHGTYKNNLREGIETDLDTDDDDFFSDEDDEDDNAFFDASRKIRDAHDHMIVFMEEGEDLLVGENNIYLDREVENDEIYYASDDELFSPVHK